ncbi:MAG TPA: ABC-2 family transporter protein [Clostridia bacterium]
MRAFLASVKIHMKSMLYYRGSFIISLLIDPVYFIINFALVSSIYSYNKTDLIKGYSMTQMIWYFAAVSFTWYFIYNSADLNISSKVLSGALTSDLQKPITIFQTELSEALAIRLLAVVFNFIPSIFIYSIFKFPSFLTLQSMLKFVIVVSFAFVIFFEINFLLGMASFIIKSNYSVQGIKFFLINLTAGAFIPLDFFPDWFNGIIKFLPFKYMFYWPIQFFLNRSFSEKPFVFLEIILIQAFWCLLLYSFCKFFWSRALKKFCAVGG